MQLLTHLLSLGLVVTSTVSAFKAPKATIEFQNSNGSLLLASKESVVNVFVDGADWPGVLRAAHDVAIDFGRVTGLNGTLTASGKGNKSAATIFNVTGIRPDWSVGSSGNGTGSSTGAGTIIAGTIGNSSLIDALIKSGKLDVSNVEGEWESYVSAVVANPMNGTDEALVIAGSDKRGTIYGLYSISEQIGVSPWYWFADVAPKSHDAIYAVKSTKVQKTPSVKYRGFFINDEAPALTGWVNARYPKSQWNSAFGAQFYSHVFELILRSKGNYLWPAMWNGMFGADDLRNQPLADEYGVVMGSSHTEPMVRATKEWRIFGEGGESGWQWATNNASLYKYFTDGIERAKDYENVVTVGMRGYHDTAMSSDVQTSVLEAVVDAQQEILTNVLGDASKVPQVWCLYKEVQDYFEAGMRVPDHVTLLWTEDNWQNIRRLPVGNETERSGGAGVYYHFDYVGDTRNFKWLPTIQLQKTYEQMRLAKDRNADRLWVVNVGDIKPYEIPISHWFDLAYDIDAFDETSTPAWIEDWASRTFDSEHAKAISDIIDKYNFLSNMRKFELVEPQDYSVLNYQEADKLIAQWIEIGKKAQAIFDVLPESQQPSFYQTVLHPVLAGGNHVDIQVSSAKNIIYSGQSRNSANKLFQRVLDGMKTDHNLTRQYHTLLNGKWNHMMDQTHINYQGYWQQPMRQMTPYLRWVQTLERSLAGDMGVTVEGSNATIPGDDIWHSNGGGSLDLVPISPYTPPRWIEIYSVGTQPFDWKIQAEPFVKLSKSSGTISPDDDDVRVYVEIDWTKAPTGTGKKTVLNITSSTGYGTQYGMPTVNLPINNTVIPSSFTNGFVESSGQVAFEAEHYTRVTPIGNLSYQLLPGLGRTLSAIKLNSNSEASAGLTSSTAPLLEYDFYTFTPTTAAKALNVTLIFSPTLNINPKQPLAYIAQIDDKPEQRRQYVVDQPQPKFPAGWEFAVAQNAWKNVTSWGEVKPGAHTLKLWLVEPNVVLQKVVLDLGGVVYSHNGPPESFRVGRNGTAARRDL
ncbi:glycoside hydrolase family 115 protein [Aaosphaeria arxii CBS 175.79]|uniref:Glycoside hydrolase family 115 protein n=1 Tax=Aaosphaeria arxii CBS 175.79 TaxID=1450172 RepID=A0A6A5XCQ2_9PLEO|nr:glycoside hydrolase family 115 protein [Aaosphaeria arxii CBS 175.79]KAF2010653.1 glycoside hydrolase family 115 protein [Aaosphaeria arxii CBS 175.79]